jgi:hypothetical protein
LAGSGRASALPFFATAFAGKYSAMSPGGQTIEKKIDSGDLSDARSIVVERTAIADIDYGPNARDPPGDEVADCFVSINARNVPLVLADIIEEIVSIRRGGRFGLAILHHLIRRPFAEIRTFPTTK